MEAPTKKVIHDVFEKLMEEYPNSQTSLSFNNPFELLVSTMLSAQTTDKAVNNITPNLFSRFPDAKSIANAELDEVKEIIKTIGLYNTKAKNLIKMSQILIELHDGKVPNNMKELTSLPGVGRKTANVVLGNAFKNPVGITIDTHMIRIMNLLGWAEGKNAEKIERQLMKFIPKQYWTEITHLIIDHGRAICKANRPKCGECVIERYCPNSKLKI
jgi:endonuclease III